MVSADRSRWTQCTHEPAGCWKHSMTKDTSTTYEVWKTCPRLVILPSLFALLQGWQARGKQQKGWSLCASHRDGLTGGKSLSCSTRFSYKLLLSLLNLRLPVFLRSVLFPYCHRDVFFYWSHSNHPHRTALVDPAGAVANKGGRLC